MNEQEKQIVNKLKEDIPEEEFAVLQGIMAEAWGKFKDTLFVEQDVAPAVKEVAEKALNEESGRFTDAERGKIRAALATGEYDKKIKVEDPDVAKEYEAFVERRIKEEIKKGNLTDYAKRSNK